jgi:protein MpaA
MASITATLMTLIVIGHSAGGRPIQAVHVGGHGPTVLVVGCIHGNECAALPIIVRLERLHPAHEDLWVIPEANPDGTAANRRTNGDGVDLNRNFPDGWRPGTYGDLQYPGPRPSSEPETRALEAFIRRIRPAVTIWYHQPQDQVRAWDGSVALARRFAGQVGLHYATLGWPSGSATHWQNVTLGDKAFVVEFPPGPLTTGEVGRNVRAVLAIAR